MSPKVRLMLLSLLLILGLSYWLHGRADQVAPVPPRAATSSAAPSAWFADPRALTPAFLMPNMPSLAQRIDTLVASGKPDDAFAAYALVRDCLYFQEHGALLLAGPPWPFRAMTDEEKSAETTLCAGMTEAIKRSRLDHLAVAAKADVMGADTAFLQEGPFGDPSALASRPDDPLVREWKQQAVAYLTNNAAGADVGSLTTLEFQYSVGSDAIAKDPAQALTYAMALHKLYDQMDGLRGTPMPYDEAQLQQMEAGMPAAQVSAAETASNAISEVYRRRRAQALAVAAQHG